MRLGEQRPRATAEDAGLWGACAGMAAGHGWSSGSMADDALADLVQPPGLGLGQRVEDQAADFLDMAGRGLGHLRLPLASQGRQDRWLG